MKFIKRLLLILLFFTVVVILFRGTVYRSLVKYDSVGERTNYSVTDDKLTHYIDTGSKSLADPEIQQIIRSALSLTSAQLNFTAQKNDNDPNKLMTSKSAHCVGYAHFFASTCNYLLDRHKLSGDWIAKPQIGQLYFLGINVHQFFSSPFLKDHDFVIIENKKTGETFAVDPTLSDYLWIDFVSNGK